MVGSANWSQAMESASEEEQARERDGDCAGGADSASAQPTVRPIQTEKQILAVASARHIQRAGRPGQVALRVLPSEL
eukprot:jgi/Mesen1/6421/ME000329S05594